MGNTNEILSIFLCIENSNKMGPKKKGGGKKKSAKAKAVKAPTLVDGVSTEEMTKEQLEEHIVRIREELDREREERNYFQLERDKVCFYLLCFTDIWKFYLLH